MKQYNTEQRAGETLDEWYTRLAKVADQRLVRLEKLSQQENYRTADKWAYQSAMIELEEWSPNADKPRFNQNKPSTDVRLQMKIQDMRNFIESPTSTKQGITEVYENRVSTFNKGNPGNFKGNYGTDFTADTLANYYNRGIADKVAKHVKGSKTALVAIGKIQKRAAEIKERRAAEGKSTNNKAILAEMRKENEIDKTVPDSLIDQQINDILADRNIPVSLLFK